MAELSWLDACQHNMRDWYLRRAEAAGGGVTRIGDSECVHVETGMKPGDWRTVLPFPRAAQDVLAQPARADPLWCTTGATPDARHPGIRGALKRRGFEHASVAVAMARPPGVPVVPALERDDLVLGDLAMHDLPATAQHPSYGRLDDPAADASWRAAKALARTERPIQQLLGAWHGPLLVATTTLHHDGFVIGLYDVATIESWRRRGVAHWMMQQALSRAQQWAPAAPVVLQNDVGLEPLYRHHGFERVGSLEHWCLPAGHAADPAEGASTAPEDLVVCAVLEDIPALDALLAAQPGLARAHLAGGVTALHIAAYNGAARSVGRLLEAGADPAARDARHGATPLEWALYGLSGQGPCFKRSQLEAAEGLMRAGSPFGDDERKSARDLGNEIERRLLCARESS